MATPAGVMTSLMGDPATDIEAGDAKKSELVRALLQQLAWRCSGAEGDTTVRQCVDAAFTGVCSASACGSERIGTASLGSSS
mmetsp:Transcript_12475/g.19753  ORF Transcript_12475/g.19753 Transcript_12475/m.19753 type:complete len:82 (-) Transcript_12475:125-370(-)